MNKQPFQTILRQMLPQDWEAVAKIYQEGIETGNATFQQTVSTWQEWDVSHLPNSRFVAKIDENIVGWAALTPVSGRCVYAGVAEVSVYVAKAYQGHKIGTILLKHLIKESEKIGIWTLQSGIFPENKASLAIHEALGFRLVGMREKIGKMNGVWRNTLLLERRNAIGL